MKKVLAGFIAASLLSVSIQAQQVARARYVNLVTTSAPADSLHLVSKGGISFTGTTSFEQHGKLTLLSNPAAGNSDWLDSTTGVITGSSTGTVIFNGTTSLQTLTGPTTFYGLTINGAGVTINQSNEVRGRLNLYDGLAFMTNRDDSLYLSNTAVASLEYNTDPFATSSWVHGKLSRRAITAGGIYEFPVGKINNGDSLYAPVKFEKQTGSVATYSVQYFPDIPVNRTSINPFFDHISALEFWEITSHAYATLADNYARLSLSWRLYSDVSNNSIHWDSLAIAHYLDPGGGNPFIWEPENVTPLAIIEPGASVNFGYFNNDKFIGDYSMPHLNFTIGTRTINNALPLNLLDYQVYPGGNRTVLNAWKTVNDTEVGHYEVERATDAINFSRLGNVSSFRAAGNSSYTFTDPNPVNGWNYYRLKIVSLTGNVEYSPLRRIYIGKDNLLTLYPNPAQDHINIVLPVFDGKGILSLADNAGRTLSVVTPSTSTVRLALDKLAAGVYHIRYVSGSEVYSKSFIHQ